MEQDARNRPRIYDPVAGSTQQHSQSNQAWLRSGFFLKQHKVLASHKSPSPVTLIIFSASSRLQRVFASLTGHEAWEDVLEDPFSLFSIILEELFLEVDDALSKVRKVLGVVERVCHVVSDSFIKADQLGCTRPGWASDRKGSV